MRKATSEAVRPERVFEPVDQNMTKVERSTLCYAETCAVDGYGLMEGVRMNGDDMVALEEFQAQGLLRFGRIKAALLGKSPSKRPYTHWIKLEAEGWRLAGLCRQLRAKAVIAYSEEVMAAAGELV